MKRGMRVNRLRGLKTVGDCWQTPNEGGRRHVTRACPGGWEIEQGSTDGWRKRYAGACPCLSETEYGCVILNKTDNLKHEPQPLVGQSRTHHKRPSTT